jgi:hypothetical protein
VQTLISQNRAKTSTRKTPLAAAPIRWEARSLKRLLAALLRSLAVPAV